MGRGGAGMSMARLQVQYDYRVANYPSFFIITEEHPTRALYIQLQALTREKNMDALKIQCHFLKRPRVRACSQVFLGVFCCWTFSIVIYDFYFGTFQPYKQDLK